jgi:hypothetical protein
MRFQGNLEHFSVAHRGGGNAAFLAGEKPIA